MMEVNDIEWSSTEQLIAEAAFNKAYEREINALIAEVRSQASSVTAVEDMWRLHDFLSARRHDLDGKYDYQFSILTFLFARLVKEGWLHLNELDGLAPDKLVKVSALTRI